MLNEIVFPLHRHFKSRTEWEPIGFFSDCLCNATQFDLMLGFFSSSAIHVLSDGFASFLYNGGRMRLIANDILTEQDREAINKGEIDTPIPFFDIKNIERLKDTLSARDTHFFDCLSWLIRNNRLDIRIIAPKNGIGISHTKSGLFSDSVNNVAFNGSCNFSRSALIDNIESLTAFCDWDANTTAATVKQIGDEFERVFTGQDENIVFVPTDNIRTHIVETFYHKELQELLEEESRFIQQDLQIKSLPQSVKEALERAKNKVESEIEEIRKQSEIIPPVDLNMPRFPYETGPREYQQQAFTNWRNNHQKGLFAMATGTGKTITALNCLLEIYNRYGYYKAIILVPTITLVEQWEAECRKFHFNSIIKVCSKYNNWSTSIANLRLLEMANPNNDSSYIIISTYASFARRDVFDSLKQFPRTRLLLIADEAHNMGSGRMAQRLCEIPYLRRIGLSATPERQFDEEGNQKLMEFFGCGEGYTFEYSMAKAIENGALCRYYYYPHIVRLTESEMKDYAALSKKIARVMDFPDLEEESLKMLLLKRKRIIHKAANKQTVFKQVLQQEWKKRGNLNYTLVYVPEGNQLDEGSVFDETDTIASDEDSAHLIEEFTRIVRDMDSRIIVRQFTSESTDRDAMLQDFSEGRINVLTSMKCLDEGVDVPRSELAIFCASTGNPRQFIQRRGRVLRTHRDKHCATIHDLIVIPDHLSNEGSFSGERSLVESELKRVRNFALLSENLNDTYNELQSVLNNYNLSLFN